MKDGQRSIYVAFIEADFFQEWIRRSFLKVSNAPFCVTSFPEQSRSKEILSVPE